MSDYIAPAEDTSRCRDVFREAESSGRYRKCVACGGETTHTNKANPPHTEYDNILLMELYGGYGMFFDNFETGNYTLVLCHDCSHDACEKLPWLNNLLKPMTSHAHTQAYKDANPDHKGWDTQDED